MTSTTVHPPVAGDPGPHLGSTVGSTDDVAHSASLRLSGELCAITAATHARQIQDLLDLGYVDLRIELDGLVLCTSDGLDLWDDAQHRLGDAGGGLTLSGANGVVRRVLEVITSSATHFCPTVLPAA
jgi:anti-anti-sigma regulatory factor